MARACSEKKALDIVTIDMRKMHNVCDYFVIASGTSTTQAGAIADNVARRMEELGFRLKHREGLSQSLWILLDYGDVVGHVFLDETRRFYDLERLWAQAPQQRFVEASAKSRAGIRLESGQRRALRVRSRKASSKARRRGRLRRRR